jgi:hypothetical protein
MVHPVIILLSFPVLVPVEKKIVAVEIKVEEPSIGTVTNNIVGCIVYKTNGTGTCCS